MLEIVSRGDNALKSAIARVRKLPAPRRFGEPDLHNDIHMHPYGDNDPYEDYTDVYGDSDDYNDQGRTDD